MPPAVRLILASVPSSSGTRAPALKAARMLVLTLPDAGLLDGLLQHPATSPWLGDRLGPTSVTIADDQLEPLRKTLKELGMRARWRILREMFAQFNPPALDKGKEKNRMEERRGLGESVNKLHARIFAGRSCAASMQSRDDESPSMANRWV